MKKYYCEFCGRFIPCGLETYNRCTFCMSKITPKKTLHDFEYYRNKSKEVYGDIAHINQILIDEEASKSPNFDLEKHQLAFKEYSKEEIQAILNKNRKENPNIPKCPTCGSTNIKKISSVSKAAHGLAFGLFSKTARSQFECLNCHYKW